MSCVGEGGLGSADGASEIAATEKKRGSVHVAGRGRWWCSVSGNGGPGEALTNFNDDGDDGARGAWTHALARTTIGW